jgi:hypothetical protein
MTDHDTRQIIIALTAIVLAWSIAWLLTITFGQPFPSESIALADRQGSLATSGPCEAGQ